MLRLTTYLLNGYKITYNNEWGFFVNNCNYICNLINRNNLNETNRLNNSNNNYEEDNNNYDNNYDNNILADY